MKTAEVLKPRHWKIFSTVRTIRIWIKAVFLEIEKNYPQHQKLCKRYQWKQFNAFHPVSNNNLLTEPFTVVHLSLQAPTPRDCLESVPQIQIDVAENSVLEDISSILWKGQKQSNDYVNIIHGTSNESHRIKDYGGEDISLDATSTSFQRPQIADKKGNPVRDCQPISNKKSLCKNPEEFSVDDKFFRTSCIGSDLLETCSSWLHHYVDKRPLSPDTDFVSTVLTPKQQDQEQHKKPTVDEDHLQHHCLIPEKVSNSHSDKERVKQTISKDPGISDVQHNLTIKDKHNNISVLENNHNADSKYAIDHTPRSKQPQLSDKIQLKPKPSNDTYKSSAPNRVIIRTDAVPKIFVKSHDVRELVTPQFSKKFRAYANENGRCSGLIISSTRSATWLTNADLNSVLDLAIVEKQFAISTGRKLVMNIFEYIHFLMKICRGKINISDLITRLCNCSNPKENEGRSRHKNNESQNSAAQREKCVFSEKIHKNTFGDIIQSTENVQRQEHFLPSSMFSIMAEKYNPKKNGENRLTVK